MAYNGPYVVKLKFDNGYWYLSRGTRRYKIEKPKDELSILALVSSKETHEGDDLLEHWVDGKWQQRKTT